MIEKLKQMKEKFIQITELISDPSVIQDTKRWQSLCKEHAQLEPIVEKFAEYEKIEDDNYSSEIIENETYDADYSTEDESTSKEFLV